MSIANLSLSRRSLLAASAWLALPAGLRWTAARAQPSGRLLRPIHSTGELIPAVGMGTWITFNVGGNERLRKERTRVLEAFFDAGGGMIDSSPMYGSSEAVVGYGLERLGGPQPLFSATKVWTSSTPKGEEQMAESRDLWGLPRLDLMQVHNLVNWRGHLERLHEARERGELRYVGVTTSHGRRHDALEPILAEEDLDFVQLTYNAVDREAEQRLLPLAAERGIAVIANRPYRQKQLVRRVQETRLPDWAGEIDCENWPQVLLKFIISHPTVTCAIPATTRVEHMRENMGALHGRQPDAELRRHIARHVADL